MANEFEKRMRRDMERRLARRSPGHPDFTPRQSNDSIVIGQVPITEETVDVDISKVKDPSHTTYRNKIGEAIAAAKKKLRE